MQAEALLSLAVPGLVFAISCAAVYFLVALAPSLELMAQPGEHRQHLNATPMVGGLAIYLALLVGSLMVGGTLLVLLPSLFLMCAVGALDDRYKLPSWIRFVAQGIAAYLMIRFTGIALLDLGYLFSTDSRVLLSNYGPTVMTVFACVGVINAINMSDGLDGLAGSLVLVVLVALAVMGHPEQALILLTISAVLGFLFWNLRIGRQQAKAFMGDAGSTMLGLLLAYLLIQYSQLSNGMPAVTALWLLTLPLIDAVAVMLVRPARGKSPFAADRIHYHHQLLDRGLSVNTVVLIAIGVQILFISIGVALWRLGVAEHIQLMLFLLVFSVYTVRLYYFSGKRLESY